MILCGYFIWTTCIKTRMDICVFLTLNYACIVAWRENLVGHIMKFSTAHPICRNCGSSISTLLKRTYSSSSLFCILRTHNLRILWHRTMSPPSHFLPSHVQPIFPPLVPHNPSVSQYPLLRKWEVLTVLRLLQPHPRAKMSYIRNTTIHNANNHLNFK